jgi:tripartite-type tricarboxylate transporter receptor subunit TctC
MTQCQAPFAIGSVKFRSIKDIPRDQRTTIGIAGVGVITHLISIRMQETYPMLDIIPYKSPSEAAIAAQSGQVDFVVGFISDIERYSDRGMNLLGVTGTQSQGKYPTLVSQGLHSSLGRMSLTHNLQVPDSWSAEKARDVREILLRAENNKSVRDNYSMDRCQPVSTADKDLLRWREEHGQIWSGLARGVKVN